jgi:hypothetical protein
MFRNHRQGTIWDRSLVVGIGLFLLILLGPRSVMAKSGGCFQVQDAGNEAVNGKYHEIGVHNQKPVYKHASSEFYVSYDALGYGSEWNLTTAIGGGLDLYFIQSEHHSVPEIGWLHGLRGLYPGGAISWESCKDLIGSSQIFQLSAGQSLEGVSGKRGIFTPEAFTSGYVVITKLSPQELPLAQNLHLHGKSIQVSFHNEDGTAYDTYQGLIYLFFNLDRQTRKLWRSGDLKIYSFSAHHTWQEIPAFWVRSRWPGRIATLITVPGIYAIGTQNE